MKRSLVIYFIDVLFAVFSFSQDVIPVVELKELKIIVVLIYCCGFLPHG
jgi:hypothetical protein